MSSDNNNMTFEVTVDRERPGGAWVWYLEATDESRMLGWYRLETWTEEPTLDEVKAAVAEFRKRQAAADKLTSQLVDL